MIVEFVDTNVHIYAHDAGSGDKHVRAGEVISRVATSGTGALSIQVLMEFYSAATRKLLISSQEAEATIRDLAGWTIHQPGHADILTAIRIQRRHRLSFWDAMVVNSAIACGSKILWTEDMNHGQKFGELVVRNPFQS
jgi:predicted nucleic acid-binding protein